MSDESIDAAQAKWRRKELRAMPESEVQRRIEATLTRAGYLVMHIRDARGQNLTGFPDVFAIHSDGRMFVAELKREGKYPKESQWRWLDRFSVVAKQWGEACIVVRVVHPSTLAGVERYILGLSSDEGNGNGTDSTT